MKTLGFLVLFLFSGLSFSQEEAGDGPSDKIKYKYRKFEKFDFDAIEIGGDKTSTGDLSITPRYQKKFDNKLPYRRNFNPEIQRAVNQIR